MEDMEIETKKSFQGYIEPLIPRTPSGISLVAVLITVSLAMLGFIGQRALDLDERVIALQEQQKTDISKNSVITEITTRLAGIEARQERRRETLQLVQVIDERLNRLEVRVEDMLRELERIRDKRDG